MWQGALTCAVAAVDVTDGDYRLLATVPLSMINILYLHHYILFFIKIGRDLYLFHIVLFYSQYAKYKMLRFVLDRRFCVYLR